MGFQEWREKNPGTFTGIAVAVFAVSILILVRSLGLFTTAPKPIEVGLYYYDLNTKKLFNHVDQAPPVATESGPIDGHDAGVRAYVFACNDCNDANDAKIAYLEMIEAGVLAKIDPTLIKGWYMNMSPVQVEGLDEGTLVRRESDRTWVPINSPEGAAITEAAQNRCGEGKAVINCVPQPTTTKK